MRESLALVYNVFKLRIGFAIMLSALAGMAVASGPSLEMWQVTALALAVLGSSAAAGAFNQYAERDLDARMKRTQTRPFVTGRYKAGPLWLTGILALLAGSVAVAGSALNGMVAVYVFLGAFVYAVVYTLWLKRITAWNIVVGGLAGSFAVMAGAAAVDPGFHAVPILLAGVLFLWTPPHFWSLALALKDDYADADVPMLPVVLGAGPAARVIFVHALVLVATSLMPISFGLGWFYAVPTALGGIWFVVAAWKLMLEPTRQMAMRSFHASLGQLSLVLVGCWLHGAFGA